MKEFECPVILGWEEVWLEFSGVAMRAQVYINGKFVKSHDGGYSTFRVNITEELQEKNVLAVSYTLQTERNIIKFFYRNCKDNRHLALEEVTINDVIDFLKAERPFGRSYSGNVPRAKCAHIITMFQVLEEMGYIGSHRVKNLLERAHEEFEVKDGEENFCNLLTKNNIITIFNK